MNNEELFGLRKMIGSGTGSMKPCVQVQWRYDDAMVPAYDRHISRAIEMFGENIWGHWQPRFPSIIRLHVNVHISKSRSCGDVLLRDDRVICHLMNDSESPECHY